MDKQFQIVRLKYKYFLYYWYSVLCDILNTLWKFILNNQLVIKALILTAHC